MAKSLAKATKEVQEENLTQRGKGRPKGSKNQITKSAKDAFHFAFEKNGGARRLAQWAKSSDANYSKFMQLYSKLIPVDITTQEEKIVIKELATLKDQDLVDMLAQAKALVATMSKKV